MRREAKIPKNDLAKKNILLIFCHINNIKIVREIHTKRNNQWIHIRILCKLDSWSYFLFSSILALASFVVHEYLSTWSAFREHTLDTFQSFFYYYFTIHSSHGVDDVEKIFLITKSWKNVWVDCTTIKSVDARLLKN